VEHSTVNDTNDGCNCESDYFFNLDQSECINPCSEDSCGDEELCIATSYNEFTCESIERCDPNPCLNEATCTNEATSYVCNCTVGYTGINCERDIERKYCAFSGKRYEGESDINNDIEYSIVNNYNTNSFVSEKTVNLDISKGEINLLIRASKMNWGADKADMTLIFKDAQDAQVLRLFLDLNNYTTNNHWYLYDSTDSEIMHVSGKMSGKTYGGLAIGDIKVSENKIEFISTSTSTSSIKEFSYSINLLSVKTVTLKLNALGTYSGSGYAHSCITIPYCGNGVQQSNELCDDGNVIDGDGCSSSCETE
jgi:cysteine-rich repeat protein